MRLAHLVRCATLFAAVAAASGALFGCASSHEGRGCEADGVYFGVGESYSLGECGVCVCGSDGGFDCAVPSPIPDGCARCVDDAGAPRAPEERWVQGGCPGQSCVCGADGAVRCAEREAECGPCVDALGRSYEVGAEVPNIGCPAGACVCQPDGSLAECYSADVECPACVDETGTDRYLGETWIPEGCGSCGCAPCTCTRHGRIECDRPFEGCEPASVTFACHATLPAGARTALAVALERPCPCGEELRCEVSVDREALALSLATTLHRPTDGCAPCMEGPVVPTVSGVCALPPLEAGTWSVSIDGARRFDLPVGVEGPGAGRQSRCVRVAEPPPWHDAWPGEVAEVLSTCLPEAPRAGAPAVVRVEHPCLDCCDARMTCTVERVFPERLHLTYRVDRAGYACPDDCAPCEGTRTVDCRVPALEPGTYELTIEGDPVSRALSVDGGPTLPICPVP